VGLLRVVIAGFVIACLSGCLFPPSFDAHQNPNPYSREQLDWLIVGSSTREDVQNHLIWPAIELGPWCIYHRNRNMGQWHVAYQQAETHLGEPNIRTYYLAISFDEYGIVQAHEVFHQDWSGCKTSGLCSEDGVVRYQGFSVLLPSANGQSQ